MTYGNPIETISLKVKKWGRKFNKNCGNLSKIKKMVENSTKIMEIHLAKKIS